MGCIVRRSSQPAKARKTKQVLFSNRPFYFNEMIVHVLMPYRVRCLVGTEGGESTGTGRDLMLRVERRQPASAVPARERLAHSGSGQKD
jgi:hypothetical protein